MAGRDLGRLLLTSCGGTSGWGAPGERGGHAAAPLVCFGTELNVEHALMRDDAHACTCAQAAAEHFLQIQSFNPAAVRHCVVPSAGFTIPCSPRDLYGWLRCENNLSPVVWRRTKVATATEGVKSKRAKLKYHPINKDLSLLSPPEEVGLAQCPSNRHIHRPNSHAACLLASLSRISCVSC